MHWGVKKKHENSGSKLHRIDKVGVIVKQSEWYLYQETYYMYLGHKNNLIYYNYNWFIFFIYN